MDNNSKTTKRYDKISGEGKRTHALWHLIPEEFPGISFEYSIDPYTKEVIDTRGKIRLDQNNGVPVPLAQIPDILTGKDTDTVDTYHADDLIRPVNLTFLADGAAVVWIDMPAALTEFLTGIAIPRYRTKFDLTKFNQARIIVGVVVIGIFNAKIRAQYSNDQSSWYYLDDSSGPSVYIGFSGLQVSSWVDLAAGAKADVFLRLVGLDGNDTTDPSFGLIAMQFK